MGRSIEYFPPDSRSGIIVAANEGSPRMTSDAGAAPAVPKPSVRAYRLTSIDMLRGLVLVIMVLDHARDDFVAGSVQNPMTDPNVSPLLFFTRWITHFCAPVFVLLAGTSAGLMIARKTPRKLGAFLLKRGLWLILIEWFVIATAWSFAPFGFAQANGLIVTPLQVIWAIGASMVVLAGLQFLGARMCLAIGLAIVFGHNLLDYVWPASTPRDGLEHPLWVALHAQMAVVAAPWRVVFAYPLLPWFGVMLCGFGIADVFRLEPPKRDAWLLRGGIGLTLAFIVIRAINAYGDPHPWQVQDRSAVGTLMSFLNTEKYPPSLLYVLMTIGPAAILCAFAERWRGALKDTLVMFGRVPFAFYVAHLYLLHTLAIALGVIQGFDARQFFVMAWAFPPGYGVPLIALYPIWVGVVALLYPLCRWVAAVKARRCDWWLSYL
jgi:uncharacterized membrane protein